MFPIGAWSPFTIRAGIQCRYSYISPTRRKLRRYLVYLSTELRIMISVFEGELNSVRRAGKEWIESERNFGHKGVTEELVYHWRCAQESIQT